MEPEHIIDITDAGAINKVPCERVNDLMAAIKGTPQVYEVAGDWFALEFDANAIESGKPWALYTIERDGTPLTPWETFATADEARTAVEALRTFWRNEGEAA